MSSNVVGVALHQFDEPGIGAALGEPVRVTAETVIEPHQICGNGIENRRAYLVTQLLIFLMETVYDGFPVN